MPIPFATSQNGRTVAALAGGSEFKVLLVFDPAVNLSETDTAAMGKVQTYRHSHLRQRELRRGAGAAVVPASIDAGPVLRLWNALSENSKEPSLNFRIFHEFDPAFDWLDLPRAEDRALVEALNG